MMISNQLNRLRKPKLLIENRVSFAGPCSELSIYDTFEAAERVLLTADQLLFCGMVSGRKIMHGGTGADAFSTVYLPHESFVLAPGESVEIDFPNASLDKPTTCLTVEISQERIQSVCDRMNTRYSPPLAMGEWHYDARFLHTHHTAATQRLLERLVTEFTEQTPDRNLMIDLGVTELVARMLRDQGRDFLLTATRLAPDATSMTSVLSYIESHLGERLNIEKLCRLSCMSRSRLYSTFKNQLGCTPGELLQQLRLKEAAKQLAQGARVTPVCFELGYNNISHFSYRFRQFFGCSPRSYRNRHYQHGLEK